MTSLVLFSQVGFAYARHDVLRDLSLQLDPGEVIVLQGCSGVGKSTLLRLAAGILRPTSGYVHIGAQRIGVVFQEPRLLPWRTALQNVMLPLLSLGMDPAQAGQKATNMLEHMGLAHFLEAVPEELSGGMKQRVIVAISLVLNPKILLADEPTTALDVTIQAQVLDTIQALRKKLDMSMILITHDLGIVAQTCEQVAIIYGGEVVEYADVFTIFENRMHPYTQGLFNSIPKLNEDVNRLVPIEGLMPDPTNLPTGCKFCTRCQYATDRCREEHPEMIDVGNGHLVRCFRAENTNAGGEQK